MRAGQTFQQATQVQTLRLCPSQGWPRHRPDKLANTQQNPAFAKLSMDRCTQAWTDGARWNNDVLSLQHRMFAFGTNRTSRDRVSMSAFGGKEDIDWTSSDVCL